MTCTPSTGHKTPLVFWRLFHLRTATAPTFPSQCLWTVTVTPLHNCTSEVATASIALFSGGMPMAQLNKQNLTAAFAVTLNLWELTTPRFQVPMTESDMGPQTVPQRDTICQKVHKVKRKVKPTQGLQICLWDLSQCFLENSVNCLKATSKPETGEKSLPPTLSQSTCHVSKYLLFVRSLFLPR